MVPYRILSRTRRESWAVHFFLLPAVALVAPFPMKSFLPDGKLLGATGLQVRGTVPLEKFRDKLQNTPNMPHFKMPQQ